MTKTHAQQPVTIPDTTREAEHDAVRLSNDLDQALERDGFTSAHNRGYDAAVRDETSRGRDQGIDNGNRNDLNRNGINDALEGPAPDVDASRKRLEDRFQSIPGTTPVLSGGDVDARWEDAESGGDETVGGSTATPEQNDVDDIGRALGVTYAAAEELRTGEKREHLDKKRWELDPASSEDYVDRTQSGT
ncbi:MAG: DUF6335 family protein [Vicinamibacterales bacterium]